MQISFKQLKAAQRDYQDWGNSLGNIDLVMMATSPEEQDGTKSKSAKPNISLQGFEGMPDFPKVEIYVPDDRKEMATADGNW